MSKSKINQKRFLRRIAKKITRAKGTVEPMKEYQAIYPTASIQTARANSSEILTSEFGRKTLSEMIELDYSRQKRSKRLSKLAEAEKLHVLQDGTTIPIPDNMASLRSLELMMKVCGDLKPDGDSIDARSVHFHISADEAKKLSDLADRLEKLESDDKK